jgi:hypothetical protein
VNMVIQGTVESRTGEERQMLDSKKISKRHEKDERKRGNSGIELQY